MNIKEYLNQACFINKDIDMKKEILKTLEDNINLADDQLLVEKLKQEQQNIKNAINKNLQTKINIFRLIEKVEDITLKSLLQYKYICGMNPEDIAKKLNYSPRHIARMHTKALLEAEKYYKIA